MDAPRPLRALPIAVLLLIAVGLTGSSVVAEPLMTCRFSDGSGAAWASGDIAICGPCLVSGGVCASALDILP